MISILNYGVGNLGSILGMFKKVGVPGQLITTAAEIEAAGSLVVPGVGKFDHAMSRIESLGLREALDEAARGRRIPVLGICLGMQLMTRGSEEGAKPGFGWVRAETRRLCVDRPDLPVPHMGWNLLRGHRESPYFAGDGFDEHRFYFVHAYAVHCDESADVMAKTTYGESFVSAFARDNIVGVQFHPEKSHKFGASFFRRFATLHGASAPEAAR